MLHNDSLTNHQEEIYPEFLLKTMDNRFLQDTLTKGQFCFSLPTTFNKWETPDSGQYDPRDAHSAYEISHFAVAPFKGEENGQPKYGKGQLFKSKSIVWMQTGITKLTPICCFRCINKEDIKRSNAKTFFSLGDFVERIQKEFRHDAYVLVKTKPLLERMIERKHILCGGVLYADALNNAEIRADEQLKEVAKELFRKDKKYKWQNEYRIALLECSDQEKTFLEIGSIEDIAIGGNLEDLRKPLDITSLTAHE